MAQIVKGVQYSTKSAEAVRRQNTTPFNIRHLPLAESWVTRIIADDHPHPLSRRSTLNPERNTMGTGSHLF